MTRSQAEIKEIVRQVDDQGFQALYKKAEDYEAQLYVHPAYKADLIAALAPEIDTRIALPSHRPSTASVQTQGIIRQSLSFHVDAPARLESQQGNPTQEGSRVDRQELFYAHAWGIKLNARGRVLSDTYRYQSASIYAAWWLEFEAFALPTEEGKREAYRSNYWPFKLQVIPPRTVKFLADDTGYPTLAVREYDIPVIEVAKRYGEKYSDDQALTILNEQFGYLRGGRDQWTEGGQLAGKKAHICLVDDGKTITHYIDLKTEAEQYRQVTKDVPNPWGATSLTIIPGRYNADAERLEDRYQPLIVDVLGEQRNVDIQRSHAASLAYTPKKHVQVLPEDVARMAAEGLAIPPLGFDNAGFANALGEIVDIGSELPESAKELLAGSLADRDAALPSPFLTNPEQATVSQGTAAAQLTAHETGNRQYDDAREHVIGGVHDVCMKLKHFICDGHMNKGYRNLDPKTVKREQITFRVTGQEPSQKYAGDYKAKEISVDPETFEDGDILEITPLAMTQSQKALQYELKKQQVVDGVQTPEDLIAVVTEDVSGTVEKLDEWRRYQQLAPAFDNMDLLASVELVKLKYGIDYSFLLMGAGQGPAANQMAQGQQEQASLQPQQSGTSMGVQTTAPPPTEVSPVEVMG